ncbi:dimeric dihydrodiol dehydrogenase [Penicillium hispanicum]|uniref:dimeric dihydrodiol dehydrogenase n=1 Tax=Penicillium hispanicum TaxID=1080232 RepID=UPI00253FFA0E|nr:dimeric dihydrodiol dehydrogenase [Penicillium hispanicum]KAJ5587603.1 dimeric dihydrodiol dehydrogenase [Penicillium hispanicum]
MVFGVFDLFYRVYAGFINPPPAKKRDDAIRFGVLGASSIAPVALIAPAKAHPGVVVAAVAARDRTRAEAYAKKHNIPIVHSNYEDLLQDPAIDAVYIALPNALHYEWALRSLRAGKHVLLEKPSCANADEARALFTHPLLKPAGAPVLLEAFHYRFHPAWQTFLARIRDPDTGACVRHAAVRQYAPKGMLRANDIRWRFELAGGAMMDFGTYAVNCLRQICGAEPAEVLEARFRGLAGAEQVDQAIWARYRMAGGATGSLVADLAAAGEWPVLPGGWTRRLPRMGWPKCEVELEEHVVEDSGAQVHTVTRTVVLWNHLAPSVYHRVDVEDVHAIRRGEQVVKTWTESKREKAYVWPVGDARAGSEKEWWTSYSYQLSEFVNKIKGLEGSGVWVDVQDSIRQMEAIDKTYRKAGLKVRPRSDFKL